MNVAEFDPVSEPSARDTNVCHKVADPPLLRCQTHRRMPRFAETKTIDDVADQFGREAFRPSRGRMKTFLVELVGDLCGSSVISQARYNAFPEAGKIRQAIIATYRPAYP